MSAWIIAYTNVNTHPQSGGQGTAAFANRAFAEKYVRILNRIHPQINHRVETAPIGTPLLEINNYSLDTLNEEDIIRRARQLHNNEYSERWWSPEEAYEANSDDEQESRRRGCIKVDRR